MKKYTISLYTASLFLLLVTYGQAQAKWSHHKKLQPEWPKQGSVEPGKPQSPETLEPTISESKLQEQIPEHILQEIRRYEGMRDFYIRRNDHVTAKRYQKKIDELKEQYGIK